MEEYKIPNPTICIALIRHILSNMDDNEIELIDKMNIHQKNNAYA